MKQTTVKINQNLTIELPQPKPHQILNDMK